MNNPVICYKIVKRLPLKDKLTCRCVCRLWKDLSEYCLRKQRKLIVSNRSREGWSWESTTNCGEDDFTGLNTITHSFKDDFWKTISLSMPNLDVIVIRTPRKVTHDFIAQVMKDRPSISIFDHREIKHGLQLKTLRNEKFNRLVDEWRQHLNLQIETGMPKHMTIHLIEGEKFIDEIISPMTLFGMTEDMEDIKEGPSKTTLKACGDSLKILFSASRDYNGNLFLDSMKEELKGCLRLESLTVNISTDLHILESSWINFFNTRGCQSLTDLSITFFGFMENRNAFVQSLTQNCRNLRTLQLDTPLSMHGYRLLAQMEHLTDVRQTLDQHLPHGVFNGNSLFEFLNTWFRRTGQHTYELKIKIDELPLHWNFFQDVTALAEEHRLESHLSPIPENGYSQYVLLSSRE